MREYFFWLGASADADRVLSATPTEPVVSAHPANAPLRYQFGEVPMTTSYAAVFDNARKGEVFCLIDPNDCVGGMRGAMARAKDIAIAFNGFEK